MAPTSSHNRAGFGVLLIGWDAAGCARVKAMLREGGRSPFKLHDWLESVGGSLDAMHAPSVDVVLFDISGGALDGFAQARSKAPHLPIVVLCEPEEEEAALQTVHLGAQEYLIKPRIEAHLLQRTLRYAIERARAEAALAHERNLLATLLENIPDRIYFKDDSSRFIRVNQAMTSFFRIARPEDAYGKTDADFFGPEHASEALEDERRVMESGEPVCEKIEKEIRTDGAESWSLTTKLPLRDPTGRIVGTCGISREITRLKKMEERLDSERKLLRSVIDNLPDCIFLKDVAGRFLIVNAAFVESLGAASAEEILGHTVHDFHSAGIADRMHVEDEKVFESNQPLVNCEEHFVDPDGKERWTLMTRVPWYSENNDVLGLVCISRDITEKKLAEENLKRAYAEVAQSREEVLGAMNKLQAAHRELRAVQMQLIEAEKMRTVGRLAAGVAHEVKNPLAVLKMGVEYLSSIEFQDENTALILQEMSDAVHRADGVIRGLLDFSAPTRLDLQPADLNLIVEDALRHVRTELKGGYNIVREFQDDLPPVRIDAAKLSQTLINLLTNAIHAMEGGGTVRVRTYSRQLTGIGQNISNSSSGSYRIGETVVIAEVDDTGPGIPEDKLGKIFEPFFTTKPTGKGTGLGLSVVKTIIDLHGGSIDLRNLSTGGARATITLPA